MVAVSQPHAQVVGIENGVAAGLAQPIRTHAQDVGVGMKEDSDVAIEPLHSPDAARSIVVEVERQGGRYRRRRERALARPAGRRGPVGAVNARRGRTAADRLVLANGHERAGQERGKRLGHRHRPCSRPAPAVRSRERLVQVDMNDVHPHVTRARAPHDGIQIGPIVVAERTGFVHQSGDGEDLFFVETQRVRIGQHQRRGPLGELLPERRPHR